MSEETAVVEEEEAPPPPPPPRLHWKERAIKLYESRQVAREQQHEMMKRKQVDQFREALTSLLNREMEPDDMRFVYEDVIFVGHAAQGQGTACEVDVEFPCSECGAARFQRVRGLADIGAILSGAVEPHECDPKARAEAQGELGADQKLIQAFREFLASELEEA